MRPSRSSAYADLCSPSRRFGSNVQRPTEHAASLTIGRGGRSWPIWNLARLAGIGAAGWKTCSPHGSDAEVPTQGELGREIKNERRTSSVQTSEP